MPNRLIPPGFEGRVTQTSPEREASFELEKAHVTAMEIIDREALDPRKLGKPYNDTDVNRDMQLVRDKEEKIRRDPNPESKRARMLAKILEVAIHQQIQAGWFGPNAHSVLPSKFDDLFHGIDLILELDIKEYNLTVPAALGIDVTYSDNELRQKIHSILEEIDNGVLATIRYYKSRDGGDVGSKFKVPRVILGMDEKPATTVARAWFEDNKALKKDPLRDMLLIEVIDQCQFFAAYATKKGNQDAAKSYLKNKKLFESLLGSQVNPQDRAKFRNDRVLIQLEKLINTI